MFWFTRSWITPAWKKNNEKKALRFVEKCTVQEQLKTIATEAPLKQVRVAAVRKLRFEEDIAEVILHNTNAENIELAKETIARLSSPEVLKNIVLSSNMDEVCLAAIYQIIVDGEGERCLLEIAKARIDNNIGRTALGRLKKSAMWVKTAMTSKDVEFRMQVVRVPVADTVLCEIAMRDDNEVIRLAALVKISDPDLLLKICLQNNNENVRLAAFPRITDPDRLFEAAKQSDVKSIALSALDSVRENDRLRELVSSACLIDVRTQALNRLNADQYEKEKLAFMIIPRFGRSKAMAVKELLPQYVPYLAGYEEVLLEVALNAGNLDSALEALRLLSKRANIKEAVNRINKMPGGDKRLELVESKVADIETRLRADKAIKSALRSIKVEANELLAESVIRFNDFRLLDTVTDKWALEDIVERVRKLPDAYERSRNIIRHSKNEAVKEAFNKIIAELEESKIESVRKTVISSDYLLSKRYDAAVELLHKFHADGSNDPELKDAYRELLNEKSINTERLLMELAKCGSDIEGVYNRLMARAESLWDLEILANYPTKQVVTVLIRILNAEGDPLKSLRAAKTLKKIYSSADAQTKTDIEQIPQKVYHAHYDVGGASCHTDSPEVPFFLDD